MLVIPSGEIHLGVTERKEGKVEGRLISHTRALTGKSFIKIKSPNAVIRFL